MKEEMMELTLSIQELCDQCGLPRRTVHFYSQQGLIPPPTGAGLGARYMEEHLLRLQLIPLLRGQGLRLDEIRGRFEELGGEPAARVLALRELLNGLGGPPGPHLAAAKAAPGSLAVSFPALSEIDAAGQACVHYPIPGGLQLIVPAHLLPGRLSKIRQLLELASQLFGSEFPKE
jgi:DNA-binding transcriptional MerR regulator